MSIDADEPDVDESSTRYQGYTDYRKVSGSVAESVENAVEAYALLKSKYKEGARVSPEFAARASARILSASLKLLPELKEESFVDEYRSIVDNWEGDDGFIRSLEEIPLVNRCPGWLHQFVREIRRAGWLLGYLKAGRDEDNSPDITPDPLEVSGMFEMK
jgi:hypothetical protein